MDKLAENMCNSLPERSPVGRFAFCGPVLHILRPKRPVWDVAGGSFSGCQPFLRKFVKKMSKKMQKTLAYGGIMCYTVPECSMHLIFVRPFSGGQTITRRN